MLAFGSGFAYGKTDLNAEFWSIQGPCSVDEGMALSFGNPPKGGVAPEKGSVSFPKVGPQTLWQFRAVLTVPETGDYRFLMSSNGDGSLSISGDAFLTTKKPGPLSNAVISSGPRGQSANQASPIFHWKKGEKHAIKMLWINGLREGFASLTWLPPGAEKPVALPIVDARGIPLLTPYQPPGETDADGDELPDDWEATHELSVHPWKGTHSAYGDADRDGLTNRQEFLAGTNPVSSEGQLGLVHRKAWQKIPDKTRGRLGGHFADMIPWVLEGVEFETGRRHIGNLNPAPGADATWVRFLLTPETDGFHNLAVEGGGSVQVLLSDDATPRKFKCLWHNGNIYDARRPGFMQKSELTESGWIHLSAGQPRLVDIRYVHSVNPDFLNIEWTTPDGIRGKIPDHCVSPWPAKEDEVLPSFEDWMDRAWREVLQDATQNAEPLDLRTATALSDGWSVFREDEMPEYPPNPNPKAEGGLVCSFGGSLEIPFSTNEEGYAVLTTRVILFPAPYTHGRVICEREVDGIRFGYQPLVLEAHRPSRFHIVTPWLEPGDHSLRLHFELMEEPSTVILNEVGVGIVSDKRLVEEIRSRLAGENQFLPRRGDGDSLISPACVEIASRLSKAPELRADARKVPLLPATTGTWWANVALPASGEPVTLDARFAADQMEAKATARWAETVISEHSEIWVRVGDSLRLTAAPADGPTDADAGIKFRGRPIPTPTGKPFVVRFDKPGKEVIEGRSQNGPSKSIVHVLPLWKERLGSPPVVSKGSVQLADIPDRSTRFPRLAEGSWPDGGDVLSFRAWPQAAETRPTDWLVYNKRAGTLRGVIRAGPAGPILGTMAFQGVTTGYSLQRQIFHHEEDMGEYRNSGLVQIHATGLPADWQFRASLQKGGVPFRPDKGSPRQQTVWPWRTGPTAVGDCWIKQDSETAPFNRLDMVLVKPPVPEERQR